MRVLTISLWFASFCLSAATKDACSLITAADAEAALGEPVGPPQSAARPSPQGDGSACKFVPAQTTGSDSKAVSVTVHYAHEDQRTSMAGMADHLRSSGYQNVHEVRGVGDAAVWASRTVAGKTTGELTVRKGKMIILIFVIAGLPDDSTALAHAKVLASKVAPKA